MTAGTRLWDTGTDGTPKLRMRMIWNIEILGQPIPLKRHRKGRYGMYDSQKMEKVSFANLARLSLNHPKITPMDGDIKASLKFHCQIPKSWSMKKKIKMEGEFKNSKPDLDNLIKFVFDALEGTFFTNDSRIVEIHAIKVFSEEPKTVVIFEEI